MALVRVWGNTYRITDCVGRVEVDTAFSKVSRTNQTTVYDTTGQHVMLEAASRLGSGFLSSDTTGEVMVRFFPGTHIHIAMQRSAAVHLLRLLERYNWALAEPLKYAYRWRKFWPAVSQIERTIVVMFVRSSNGGRFRGSVCLRPLPHEVADFAGDRTLVKLEAEDAREFAALRHMFVKTVVRIDDIKAKLHESHGTVMKAYGAASEAALHSWWSGGGLFDFSDLMQAALFAAGLSMDDAQRTASDMGNQALYVIHAHEESNAEDIQLFH